MPPDDGPEPGTQLNLLFGTAGVIMSMSSVIKRPLPFRVLYAEF